MCTFLSILNPHIFFCRNSIKVDPLQLARMANENSLNETLGTSVEVDSDTEDDPGQLLNMWLGELNTLKKVRKGGFYLRYWQPDDLCSQAGSSFTACFYT